MNTKDHNARDESKSQLGTKTNAERKDFSAEDGIASGESPALNKSSDGLGRGVWKNGIRIAFRVLISCYCFWTLAVICDEYFIGSIEILCQSQ